LSHAWIKLVFRRGLGGAARVLAGDYFDAMCPNFILAEDCLALGRHDLYTSWEMAQAVPVFGNALCHRFLEANAWIAEYLPNSLAGPRRPPEPVRQIVARSCVAPAAYLPRAAARMAEALLPAPIAGGMERGLRTWLCRRYAARRRALELTSRPEI